MIYANKSVHSIRSSKGTSIDGMRELQRELQLYLDSLDKKFRAAFYDYEKRKWKVDFYGTVGDLFHDTYRLSGNVLSTIKNHEFYLRNQPDKIASSEHNLMHRWYEFILQVQALEIIVETTTK